MGTRKCFNRNLRKIELNLDIKDLKTGTWEKISKNKIKILQQKWKTSSDIFR